jgi:hypothetical protein
MTENWYYKLMGLEFGPVARNVVAEMVQGNHLTATDEVRRDDGSWSPVESFSELQEKQPQVRAGSNHRSQESKANTEVAVADAESARGAPEPDPRWYCYVLERQLGPMTLDDLCRMVTNGELSSRDFVKQGLHGRWTAACRMPGLYFTRVGVT